MSRTFHDRTCRSRQLIVLAAFLAALGVGACGSSSDYDPSDSCGAGQHFVDGEGCVPNGE